MRTRARFSENQSTVLREPEHGCPRTRAWSSENQSTVLQEPEHGSPRTRARFSKNQSMVLREPEHGSPRTRAWFSENQSTVVQEPEHGSPRTGARFSENQSTPKLENRKTPQWRTGEHLHVLHVLPSGMVGWNDLCTPGHLHHSATFVNKIDTNECPDKCTNIKIHLQYLSDSGVHLNFGQRQVTRGKEDISGSSWNMYPPSTISPKQGPLQIIK